MITSGILDFQNDREAKLPCGELFYANSFEAVGYYKAIPHPQGKGAFYIDLDKGICKYHLLNLKGEFVPHEDDLLTYEVKHSEPLVFIPKSELPENYQWGDDYIPMIIE